MLYPTFERFRPIIAALTPQDLAGGDGLLEKLELARDGNFRACYTPFEYVNEHARVVVVGITPGHRQLVNAIAECRRQIITGADAHQALRAAKLTGAFSGPLRPNLVALLDRIGVQRYLGIASCASLFAEDARLIQTASVLRNAVFLGAENYSGTPSIVKTPFLRARLFAELGADARLLPNALYIPLGDSVAEALNLLVAHGGLRASQVLDGLPHPSGANAERIAYFLGKKERSTLSPKTSASKLDAARERLVAKLGAL